MFDWSFRLHRFIYAQNLSTHMSSSHAEHRGGIFGWYKWIEKTIKALKSHLLTIYYAQQHESCGWMPRLLASLAVAYAISPIDLIPDFIPFLGLIDDMVILPALFWVAIRMIPEEAMQYGRSRAEEEPLRLSSCWEMAVVFFILWDICLGVLLWFILKACCGGSMSLLLRSCIVVGSVMGAGIAEGLWLFSTIQKERQCSVTNSVQDQTVEDVEDIEKPLLQNRDEEQ